jgi:hypothetical protein
MLVKACDEVYEHVEEVSTVTNLQKSGLGENEDKQGYELIC